MFTGVMYDHTGGKGMREIAVVIMFLLSALAIAEAGEADVVMVKARKSGVNSYQFDVTVSHGDEGWNHYVDKWDILGPDITVIGTRTLYHPHVDEQPFTRNLSEVKIPEEIGKVTVRAHDSVHGYGGKEVSVVLPR